MVKRILMCAVVTVCVAGLSFAGQQDNQNKKNSSQSSSTQSSANQSGSGQNSWERASQNSASQNNSAKNGSSWTGWITDSDCGAKGASANHADCAKKCVADKGAKYVLYNTSEQESI